MDKLLGILLFSFLTTFLMAVPFINLLYRLKFQRQKEDQKDVFGKFTSIVNKMHGWKVGTPNAGGILIILVTIVFSAIFYKLTLFHLNWTAYVLYLTLIGFGALGLYDDIRKFYGFQQAGAWGLRFRYKALLQIIMSLGVGFLLYSQIGLNSIHVPIFNFDIFLGGLYIFWAGFVIFASTNAVNIADGLDGLATGVILFSLAAFWYLSSIAYLGDVELFIAVITGSLLAFLYFNIYPARVWLGDTGALSLGAVLAVIALLLDASLILPFVGFIFVIEAASSIIQIFSKAVYKRKILLAAPLHHHFEAKGWEETKVTMRFWLAACLFVFVGLFIALI